MKQGQYCIPREGSQTPMHDGAHALSAESTCKRLKEEWRIFSMKPTYRFALCSRTLYVDIEAACLNCKATRWTRPKWKCLLYTFWWERRQNLIHRNRILFSFGALVLFWLPIAQKISTEGQVKFPLGRRHPKTYWSCYTSAYAFFKQMNCFILNPCQTTRTGW